MIVEDEEITAMAIEMSLKKMGFEVVGMENTGEDAITTAHKTRPDLVLMDIKLKGAMSGTEAATKIRQASDIPVVYLTAFSDDETLEKAKIANPYGYVLKPYQDQELHAAVVMALHNASLERSRAQVEEAIRGREKLLQDVLDNSPAAVWIKDRDGRYLFVNRQFERLQAVERSALTGRREHDGFPPVHTAEGIENDKRVLSTGIPLESEETVQAAGETHTFLALRFPLADSSGTLYGLACVMTDITLLKRTRDDLEARVTERTRELAAVSAELTTFVDSVGQDLSAPVRRLTHLTTELHEDYCTSLSAAGTIIVARIREESQRLTTLLTELLVFARSARGEMRVQHVDLTDIAHEIIADLRENEPHRRAELTIQEGVVAYGDALLIRLVMENLLGNAWKFTSKTLAANIAFGATTSDDGTQTYHVRDNGAGFDPSREANLFKSFQRLHDHTEFEGTGLGLSTVRRIIQRHNGRVWAEGTPGQGATFYFTLGPVSSGRDGAAGQKSAGE